MTGGGTTAVYRVAAVLLWALAIWHSWMSRALFVDGGPTLVLMMHNGGYALLWDARQTLTAVTQAPAALALNLGVTDSHLLARLLSAGLFFVPTAYYHASLWRARHDPALLGAVLLAIAVVFLPTSFFIIGEYNTVFAAVLFAAVMLATADRPTVGDSLPLIATALMLLRSYETMLVFGPLVAGLVVWRLKRSGRRDIGSLLYGLVAVLFLASAGFSLQSMHVWHDDPNHVHDTLAGIGLFWTNLQFVLPLSALLVVALAGLIAPRSLGSIRPYLVPGFLLVLIALSPLLWLGDGTLRPYPKGHYHSRVVASMVTAAIVIAIWLYALRPAWAPKAFEVLARPANGRRLMLFGLAAYLAALPADIVLSELWRRSVVAFQATIAARPGLIPVEETAFSRDPYQHLIENWTLPSQSLALRRNPGDGVIVPPRGFAHWQFKDANSWGNDISRYRWDDGR
jgi:hypothetical protein